MATIKVKLRPSLVKGRAGTIFYQISHRRTTQQITTSIKLHPHEWDPVKEQIIMDVNNRVIVQNRIDCDTALLKHIVKDFEHKEINYSAYDIVRLYKSMECNISVFDFMHTQIQLMRDSNRLGTALNYEKTLKNFTEFFGGVDLPIPVINEQLIAEYNAFLIKRRMVRNSISFYMRIMRAVYNKAVRQKLVNQTYPFTDVYTGIDKTRKRAVSESVISQLYKLNLTENSSLALARDIFIFSYFARGMAFVDIAFLTKKDIRNNRILYRRHKTKQLLDIKIENSIKEIMDKYKEQSDLYVYPIISSNDAKEAYKQYQSAINKYNRLLVILSRKINNDVKLTSYVARHSWASAARKHNIPISIISAGLGHSNETTTQIYLTGIENSLINKANTILIKNLKR